MDAGTGTVAGAERDGRVRGADTGDSGAGTVAARGTGVRVGATTGGDADVPAEGEAESRGTSISGPCRSGPTGRAPLGGRVKTGAAPLPAASCAVAGAAASRDGTVMNRAERRNAMLQGHGGRA
ncbi:MAG: hypothetical protein ABW039_04335 [Sphingobium sp.]